MNQCPFCLNQIRDQAIKCRHCGEYVAGNRVLWREFHHFFSRLSRDERQDVLESMNPDQFKFFSRVLWGQGKIHRNSEPTYPILSSTEVRNLRRFTLSIATVFTVAFILYMLYPHVSVSQPTFAYRSEMFDVPVPPAAELQPSSQGRNGKANDRHEEYSIEAPGEKVVEFFEFQMPLEGWHRYGAIIDNRMVYTDGRRMLGVIVDEGRNKLVLTAPR